VVFTAQVALPLIGTDAFQESDITGITLPITKHSYLLKDATDMSFTVGKAFYLATTGRPGPIVVDIPVDVAQAKSTPKIEAQTEECVQHSKISAPAGYDPYPQADASDLGYAAELLSAASRPLIIAGGGIITAGATEELTTFARQHVLPVVSTMMGRGAFPEDDSLWLGMVGMFPPPTVTGALQEADLVLALGTRLTERVASTWQDFAPKAQLIHVDIDAAELQKRHPTTFSINADVRDVLAALCSEWQTAGEKESAKAPLISATVAGSQFRHVAQNSAPAKKGAALTPQHIVTALDALTHKCEAAGQPVIRVTEVGQNQLWAAQYSRVTRPRSFLTSGGLGAMGFGLPAAVGAQIACPDALVINISGDGSLQMNMQELATVVQEQLPLLIVVLNNAGLGLVRQWQHTLCDSRLTASNLDSATPELTQLAVAYHIAAYSADTEAVFDEALTQARSIVGAGKPALIDCHIEPDFEVAIPNDKEGL
jgi:acetolactate synthase-1/2/3 large subunit